VKLSATTTVAQFNRGYWYAVELKEFAKKIGIPIKAWKILKTLDIPKDYRSWKKLQGGSR
jgi:hypothetical protein